MVNCVRMELRANDTFLSVRLDVNDSHSSLQFGTVLPVCFDKPGDPLNVDNGYLLVCLHEQIAILLVISCCRVSR